MQVNAVALFLERIDGIYFSENTSDNLREQLKKEFKVKRPSFWKQCSDLGMTVILDTATNPDDFFCSDSSIRFYAESSIKIGTSVLGKISVMDLAPRKTFDKSLLQHISSIMSNRLKLFRESFLKSAKLVQDVFSDIRAPLLALKMSSILLKEHSHQCYSESLLEGEGNRPYQSIHGSFRAVLSSVTFLSSCVDEYMLLQKACLISESSLAHRQMGFINVLRNASDLIDKNESFRGLKISESNFRNKRIYSSPEVWTLLLSLTVRWLMRSWTCIRVHAQGKICAETIKSVELTTLPEIEQYDQKYMQIELVFECQEKVHTTNPTPYGKESLTSTALHMLLQSLNGSLETRYIDQLFVGDEEKYVHAYTVTCPWVPYQDSLENTTESNWLTPKRSHSFVPADSGQYFVFNSFINLLSRNALLPPCYLFDVDSNGGQCELQPS